MKQTLSLLAAIMLFGACGNHDNTPSASKAAQARVANVAVNAHGYEPASVRAKPGERLRLRFTRTTDKGCGEYIAVPSLNIKKELPVGQAVDIDLQAPEDGHVAFTCGMGMFKGSVVVGE